MTYCIFSVQTQCVWGLIQRSAETESIRKTERQRDGRRQRPETKTETETETETEFEFD